MIPNEMIAWGQSGCLIREIAEYADALAQKIGAENVFNFSIGSPSVEPPPVMQETMERLMKTVPAVKLHSYTPAAGLPEVRARMAEFLSSSFGKHYDANDIYMTAGACGALAVIIHAVNCEGDEVVTLTPYFNEYKVYVEHAGASIVEVPSRPDDLQIDIAALEKAINAKTSSVILNSPNNPSGVVLNEESIRAAAELLERKQKEYGHPIYIIADEPYRELVYGGAEVPFIPNYYKNTVYCYSFSKTLSIPGERVGFLAVAKDCENHDDVMNAIAGSTRALGYINVSCMFQLVVKECIGQTSDISRYETNRNFIYNSLTELGYTCVKPDGAFYLFMKLPGAPGEFFERAKELGVMIVPGEEFSYPGFARLAYCVPLEKLQGSIPRFRQLAEEFLK
ncbi:MAG: pyridoxal phosphate-dependent aminotransferase [Firmicutes bacterium]|nr:pyridoxal phosphate-dependent aminotransferase [Bacillota bacterium]